MHYTGHCTARMTTDIFFFTLEKIQRWKNNIDQTFISTGSIIASLIFHTFFYLRLEWSFGKLKEKRRRERKKRKVLPEHGRIDT